MNRKETSELSRFLSFVLRHGPHSLGLTLDAEGWIDIDRLLQACHRHGRSITREALDDVVATSPKRRFAISDDGIRIRANQGHTVPVELDHPMAKPPELLFHGTVGASLQSIRSEGLKRMERHHVHLSPDRESASLVGSRRGRAVVLVIEAGRMDHDGHRFYLSPNEVWLTQEVPPEYIRFPEDS